MLNLPSQPQSNVALLSPTVFYLEDAHYSQAKAFVAEQGGDEDTQWQAYLNLLGLLSFKDWLAEQNFSVQGSNTTPALEGSDHIQLGEFRLFVLSAEHVLSEQVEFSAEAIESPMQAAHFYTLLEISEEQDEVWFRGFMRRDQLLKVSQRENESFVVPLAAFEPEPSRLLSYCRHLESNAIELPQADLAQINTAQASEYVDRTTIDRTTIAETLSATRTRLSQWLDNVVDGGWQAWASLQPQVAYATRSLGTGVRCGKLVHLEMQVAENPLALVLTLTPEADDKVSILVQLLPTGRDRFLIPNVHLSLISKKGRLLQSITSHSRDNYMQLKSFKGKVGMCFSLKVQLRSAAVTEDFEI